MNGGAPGVVGADRLLCLYTPRSWSGEETPAPYRYGLQRTTRGWRTPATICNPVRPWGWAPIWGYVAQWTEDMGRLLRGFRVGTDPESRGIGNRGPRPRGIGHPRSPRSGGAITRSLAQEYPDQATALVRINASHPEPVERWPESRCGQPEWGLRMMRLAPALPSVGVLRATHRIGRLGRGLPEWEHCSAHHFLASPRQLRPAGAELDAFAATAEQLCAPSLPRRPPW